MTQLESHSHSQSQSLSVTSASTEDECITFDHLPMRIDAVEIDNRDLNIVWRVRKCMFDLLQERGITTVSQLSIAHIREAEMDGWRLEICRTIDSLCAYARREPFHPDHLYGMGFTFISSAEKELVLAKAVGVLSDDEVRVFHSIYEEHIAAALSRDAEIYVQRALSQAEQNGGNVVFHIRSAAHAIRRARSAGADMTDVRVFFREHLSAIRQLVAGNA